jgi:hypothetical protein
MTNNRKWAPRRGRPRLGWLSTGQKAALALGAAGLGMEAVHPITLRWLEARQLIRPRGPGPYTPWVTTTAGRAAHQWGHYTPLHDLIPGRSVTLAELETTYVVLTEMFAHDQAQGQPRDRELVDAQQKVAGLLAHGLGLPETALPGRYATHIAAEAEFAHRVRAIVGGPAGTTR